MKRLLFVLAVLLLSAPAWGQEIVVFQDYRSLVVQSHRVQGDWTYLNINNGELAVQSSLILEIRKEGSEIRAPELPTAAPQAAPESPKLARPPNPRGLRPGAMRPPSRQPRQLAQPQPAPMAEEEADDEDDEGDDEGDDDDDEPAQPIQQPPLNPARRPASPPSEIAKPEGMAVPSNVVRE